MKKIISLILALIIAVGLCACGAQNTENDGNGGKAQADEQTDSANDDDKGEAPKEKLQGTITEASGFSEGLAFVRVDNKQDKTYCINKNGEIVFTLDNEAVKQNDFDIEELTFKNGYTIIDGAVCDVKGKLTYPKDADVTDFSLLAISDGFIIAEKEYDTGDDSETRIGVMNTSFKWVVEPSAEVGGKMAGLLDESLDAELYYKDGIACFVNEDSDELYSDVEFWYYNVKTGELTEVASSAMPSDCWQYDYDNRAWCDCDENVMLDIAEKYGEEGDGSIFVNGKAAVSLEDEQSGSYYFTIIDEQGNQQFEPVSIGEVSSEIQGFDGTYTVIGTGLSGLGTLKCYDDKGQLTWDSGKNLDAEISENVIKCENQDKEYTYYTPTGEKLF